MKCPVCSNLMSEESFGNVKVDVCRIGCKGLFFQWSELEKLDEKNEGFGQALQDALQYDRRNQASRVPLSCPKCRVQMHSHKYHSDKEINIDECYSCGAFFLDSGELYSIRENHMSEAERKQYAMDILDDVPGYAKGAADLQKSAHRTEAIQKYTKFVRLSYYKTGK